jgi:hypothetical protein
VLPGVEDRYIARSVGNERGDIRPRTARDAAGRRDFLRKSAIVGTGAFAAPMIITVEPADAQAITSPPPRPPGSTGPEAPGAGLQRPSGTEAPPSAARPQASGRSELARTGADIDRMVAAGLAATAGGAALVLWSADMKSKSAAPRPAAPEPEA